MKTMRKYFFLKQFPKFAYSCGVIFLVAGMMLSLVSQPVDASNRGRGNPSGASLSFTAGCDGDCEQITATVCNTGDGDMPAPSSWELLYSPQGANQRASAGVTGQINALKSGECQVLVAEPVMGAGQYWFMANQPAGHPGTGVLYSEGCEIEACQVIEDPTPDPTIEPTSTPTAEPTAQPTATPGIQPKVEFTAQDTGICEYDAMEITVTIVVTLPEGMTARLQAEYHIVHPVRTPHYYIDAGIVEDGDTFTYSGYWPGIQPGDDVVEIHFGAALLDVETLIPLGVTDSLDYFWYPWICPAPTPTPVPMQALQFDYGCTDDAMLVWTASNPNPFDVQLNWSVQDEDRSGNETIAALSSAQIIASPTKSQTLLFSWVGPDSQTGSATETNGDDHCVVAEPTPTPTEDPGDPGDPTPTPTSQPEDDQPQPTPTPTPAPQDDPGDTQDEEDFDQPPLVGVVPPAPLEPPLAVASAQEAQVLIPVTGADLAMPATTPLHLILIYLGLVMIGMALMTQAVARKFVDL